MLIFCTALIFTGCVKNHTTEGPRKPDGAISVTAALFPIYDFTRAAAGDAAKITMLIPPDTDMHSYKPSPQDVAILHNSDIFLYIGGPSDAWADEAIAAVQKARLAAGARRLKTVRLIESIDVLREGESGAYDEHIWTTPSNALLMLHAITAALCEMDNGNVKTYVHNAAVYIDRLTELNAAFRAAVNESPQKTIVFAGGFPFRYFVERYGLAYYAAFPGCPAAIEPEDAPAAFLIDTIKAEKIPVILYTEYSGEKQAEAVQKAAGVKKLLFHSAQNVSQKEFEAGITYLDIMYKNAEHLKQALQQRSSQNDF
ncbi:MAG: metal ABC transporter substrate-binding protein [Spirochaetaceae bacterium]|nr:metal ABC transporter substrate-binding protein [Spirochaetaceae bacterium]